MNPKEKSEIKIVTGNYCITARIYQTKTAKEILNMLPIQGIANVWGNEIYFPISLRMEEEAEARDELEIGELGFWPTGSAFCIFFGSTPVSRNNEPRAYSNVNVFGKIINGSEYLKKIKQGDLIKVMNNV